MNVLAARRKNVMRVYLYLSPPPEVLSFQLLSSALPTWLQTNTDVSNGGKKRKHLKSCTTVTTGETTFVNKQFLQPHTH